MGPVEGRGENRGNRSRRSAGTSTQVETNGSAMPNVADVVADGLMTVAASAVFLSLSRSKIYEMMNAGELVYTKLGRARRIPRRAVVQLAVANLKGGWRGAGS